MQRNITQSEIDKLADINITVSRNFDNLLERQEYANFASLPVSGFANVLYETTDNNSLYKWNGASYVELSKAETSQSIGNLVNASTSKTTPIDADQVGLMDSAAGNILKKLSWLNIKNTLKTYFDTIYQVILVSGTNIKTVKGVSVLGSGDIPITENATHTGEVTGATALTITNNVVSNAKLSTIATQTIKGRNTAGTGNVEDLTATQVRTIINVADGATANAKATSTELNTGTDDVKFATSLGLENSKYLNQNGTKLSAVASGTNTYTATLTPAITAYTSTQLFFIRFTNANTAACTINLNGLGAKSILKNSNVALVAGDIIAGQIYCIAYDGTNFQLVNRFVSFVEADGAGTNPASINTWLATTIPGAPANSLIQLMIINDSNGRDIGARPVGSSLNRVLFNSKKGPYTMLVNTNASGQVELYSSNLGDTLFRYWGKLS